MANQVIMVDTSILIDYYRKTDKNNSQWISLINRGFEFTISAITKYEIYSGATKSQIEFWDNIFKAIIIIPFDDSTVDKAVEINSNLKRKSQQIDIADLFIAATAIANNLSFATLNRKHFDRIDDLNIIE